MWDFSECVIVIVIASIRSPFAHFILHPSSVTTRQLLLFIEAAFPTVADHSRASFTEALTLVHSLCRIRTLLPLFSLTSTSSSMNLTCSSISSCSFSIKFVLSSPPHRTSTPCVLLLHGRLHVPRTPSSYDRTRFFGDDEGCKCEHKSKAKKQARVVGGEVVSSPETPSHAPTAKPQAQSALSSRNGAPISTLLKRSITCSQV